MSPVISPTILALIVFGSRRVTLPVPSKLLAVPELVPSEIVKVRVFLSLVADATLSVK